MNKTLKENSFLYLPEWYKRRAEARKRLRLIKKIAVFCAVITVGLVIYLVLSGELSNSLNQSPHMLLAPLDPSQETSIPPSSQTEIIPSVPGSPSTQTIALVTPVAQFTATTMQGGDLLGVQFTDQSVSEGLTSYAWDVNDDGIMDYSTQNPVHTYSYPGSYPVRLTVTDAYGRSSETKKKYITLLPPPAEEPGGAETFGAEPNPTGNPIGGGAGYTRIISETDARVKYVVSTRDQLVAALKSATSGEVVFVKATADIDMSSAVGTVIPSGVILASDRGLNGSLGGRIFRTRSGGSGLATLAAGDTVRITGLRIEGPDTAQNQDLGNNVLGAIQASDSKDLEVDNCELSGWSYAAVAFDRSAGSTATGYVHHNYIHHCQEKGYGYGVAKSFGSAIIEANLFDYMRHAVADSGEVGSSYEARYNIFLTHCIDAVFDMHPNPMPPSPLSHTGDLYKIHHNTIGVTDQAAVSVGAMPAIGVFVDHNRFASDFASVYQWESQGYGRVYVTRNMIGGVLYADGPIHSN